MRAITRKVRPTSGFAHYFHLALVALVPLLVYVFVRIEFASVALAVILLSKWRMLVVRPRYWAAAIRANSVDITVGLSFLAFMTSTDEVKWQLIWALLFGLWLIFIKPRSSVALVSLQALLSQFMGLVALFLAWKDIPLVAIVVGVWAICYFSARHFFSAFDERYATMYSDLWGYFGGALAWVLGHWLLFYGNISQITLLLSVIGFSLAGMYYLNENEKLTAVIRRQFIFIMFAVIAVIIIFSDWEDKAF